MKDGSTSTKSDEKFATTKGDTMKQVKSFYCKRCLKVFKTKRGLTTHHRKCLIPIKSESFFRVDADERGKSYDTSYKVLPPSQPLLSEPLSSELLSSEQEAVYFEEEMKEVEQDIEKISQSSDGVKKVDFDKRSNTANLPSYERMLAIPMKIWTIIGPEFIKVVESSYNEVIKWRKNIFKIPSGRSSKDLVNELTYWLDQYNRETEFHGVALKVFMLLPSLLLQKPSKNSKGPFSQVRRKIESVERR